MHSTSTLPPTIPSLNEMSQILDTFSTFFQKAVSTHPKKTQILSQMTSFLTFLSNNREDLSKGYLYLKEMKSAYNSEPHSQKIEIALHYLKTTDSQYHKMKEINEFDVLQEMKTFNCDPKSFSYDLLLLCVSVRYWDVLLSYIDQNQLNLFQTIKEKVFHDTLSQAVQEKIMYFFEKIEEIAKNEKIPYKKAFAKVSTFDKPTDFLITMIPVIKQIIIKFLINSEWNFVREKLQDKLNTNSLNQIFTLFKNQTNFPQKETEIQILEENTQNFLQILALGLNVNIKILWSNSSIEGEKGLINSKSFQAKNEEDALGTVTVFVIKQQNIWLYYNVYNSENWGLEDNVLTNNVNKKSVEMENKEKFESSKHNNFNNFSKSTSIKITDDMFPLNSLNKQSVEENTSNITKVNFIF